MTKKTWLPLFSLLLLTLAAGGTALATEPAQVPVTPQPAAVTPDLTELLQEEPVMTSLPAEPAEPTDLLALPTDTAWGYGICWTSCYPCRSNADCPWGENCQFNVHCP